MRWSESGKTHKEENAIILANLVIKLRNGFTFIKSEVSQIEPTAIAI